MALYGPHGEENYVHNSAVMAGEITSLDYWLRGPSPQRRVSMGVSCDAIARLATIVKWSTSISGVRRNREFKPRLPSRLKRRRGLRRWRRRHDGAARRWFVRVREGGSRSATRSRRTLTSRHTSRHVTRPVTSHVPSRHTSRHVTRHRVLTWPQCVISWSQRTTCVWAPLFFSLLFEFEIPALPSSAALGGRTALTMPGPALREPRQRQMSPGQARCAAGRRERATR